MSPSPGHLAAARRPAAQSRGGGLPGTLRTHAIHADPYVAALPCNPGSAVTRELPGGFSNSDTRRPRPVYRGRIRSAQRNVALAPRSAPWLATLRRSAAAAPTACRSGWNGPAGHPDQHVAAPRTRRRARSAKASCALTLVNASTRRWASIQDVEWGPLETDKACEPDAAHVDRPIAVPSSQGNCCVPGIALDVVRLGGNVGQLLCRRLRGRNSDPHRTRSPCGLRGPQQRS